MHKIIISTVLWVVLASSPAAKMSWLTRSTLSSSEAHKLTIECNEDDFRQAVQQGGEIVLPPHCVLILTQDLPPIGANINITGQTSVIDGNGQYRIFYAEHANITLDGLTVRQGASSTHGGGLFVRQGNIIVKNSVFEANVSAGMGGALMVETGDLTITDTIFEGNSAEVGGGAVAIGAGNLTIMRSRFDNNTSNGCGAGILVDHATMTIASSAFVKNTVVTHGGGALCLTTADVVAEIVNSTISHNQANRGGGGIAVNEAHITIKNCTITGNRARRGGGIWANGTVNLQQSIVLGNTAAIDTEISMSMGANPVFNSWGYNLLEEHSTLNLAASDLFSHSTGLEPLTSEVHLLSTESPGLDAIPPEHCATDMDQRGILRPQNGRCDIGAVEME